MTIHSGQELREAYQHRTWEYYRPVLAALVEFLPPGVILDVGAGIGLFVECCARLGLSCVGLEGALEGVAMAQARGIRLVAGRLEFGLPFRDASFAAVVCNQVIEHLHDATADLVLRESHRVLAPGGVLMIQSPSPYDPDQRREPGHINLYTPSRLRHAVEVHGFHVLVARDVATAPLGHGRFRDLLFNGLLRATHWDALSASANVVARRVP